MSDERVLNENGNIPTIEGGQEVVVDAEGLGYIVPSDENSLKTVVTVGDSGEQVSDQTIEMSGVAANEEQVASDRSYFYKSEAPVVKDFPNEVDPEGSVYVKSAGDGKNFVSSLNDYSKGYLYHKEGDDYGVKPEGYGFKVKEGEAENLEGDPKEFVSSHKKLELNKESLSKLSRLNHRVEENWNHLRVIGSDLLSEGNIKGNNLDNLLQLDWGSGADMDYVMARPWLVSAIRGGSPIYFRFGDTASDPVFSVQAEVYVNELGIPRTGGIVRLINGAEFGGDELTKRGRECEVMGMEYVGEFEPKTKYSGTISIEEVSNMLEGRGGSQELPSEENASTKKKKGKWESFVKLIGF